MNCIHWLISTWTVCAINIKGFFRHWANETIAFFFILVVLDIWMGRFVLVPSSLTSLMVFLLCTIIYDSACIVKVVMCSSWTFWIPPFIPAGPLQGGQFDKRGGVKMTFRLQLKHNHNNPMRTRICCHGNKHSPTLSNPNWSAIFLKTPKTNRPCQGAKVAIHTTTRRLNDLEEISIGQSTYCIQPNGNQLLHMKRNPVESLLSWRSASCLNAVSSLVCDGCVCEWAGDGAKEV